MTADQWIKKSEIELVIREYVLCNDQQYTGSILWQPINKMMALA